MNPWHSQCLICRGKLYEVVRKVVGKSMVTEMVSEYGRSAASIASNVTEICGNCCKDHIVEASTVVTEEFASEVSSSAAKWWIAQASLAAGRNAMTGFFFNFYLLKYA